MEIYGKDKSNPPVLSVVTFQSILSLIIDKVNGKKERSVIRFNTVDENLLILRMAILQSGINLWTKMVLSKLFC